MAGMRAATMTPLPTDQIRAVVNLAVIAGQYVKLRPSGINRLQGLCPFHKEKTPSFTVNTERQRYHCFGCMADGDVFKFIQVIEGISFPESVRLLADRSGVSLRPVADRAAAARQRIYAAEIGPEAHCYWIGLRAMYSRYEGDAYESVRRAERWLKKRNDADLPMDTPAAQYAWFWLHRGDSIAEMWRAQITQIEESDPQALIATYEWLTREKPGVREKVKSRMADSVSFVGLVVDMVTAA